MIVGKLLVVIDMGHLNGTTTLITVCTLITLDVIAAAVAKAGQPALY